MSDDAIILVENLGKKYRIRHEQANGMRYKALREVIADKFKNLFSSPRSALRTPDSAEDFWALKDVSFEVKRGEVVGIIGRNGAGKSTLLKILSRITEPTEGRVRIRGRVASLLEVGTGFHPELTGRENIFLNGAILGMSRAEIKKKFDEIVGFAEIEKFLDTPVKRYSSGMYVRLAFAVAAHLDPEILIVDEVLAVGDAEFQKKCLGKMDEVSRGGRTVLFVSHNMGAVRSLCDRAMLVASGKLCFVGSPVEAVAAYGGESRGTKGAVWIRPAPRGTATPGFEKIHAFLTGAQPQLGLHCDVELSLAQDSPPVFVAVDICDHTATPFMQALPSPTPFINAKSGSCRLRLEIDLPALIPGHYALDFWMGTHFSRTVDYVRDAVAFEIAESPTIGRSFGHSRDHGFVVPTSRCLVCDN